VQASRRHRPSALPRRPSRLTRGEGEGSFEPQPSIRAGELFLEKYNSPDANQSFQEALAVNPNHPEALLELA
jgi:hypothetical protein